MGGDVYKRAADTWGEESQVGMLIEEMGELLSAINRRHRCRTDKSTVEEELADVEIMLAQMRIIFDADLVDEWKAIKTKRLAVNLGMEVEDMKDKPRGIRNNNPGNIRENQYTDYAWDGEAEGDWDPDFEEFTEMVYGIRAMAKILITYRDKHGLKNPEQVIKRWAPASDNNDTMAYIRHVEKMVNRKCWNMQSQVAIAEYVRAICTHENGAKWSSEWMRFVTEGVGMAV